VATLTETITDKESEIAAQKTANKELGKKITELDLELKLFKKY